MRRPRLRMIAEIGLFIVVVVACTVNFHEERPVRAAALSAPPQDDALKAELLRCQNLGKAARDDSACTAAWTENRRRFFAPEHKADPDRNASDQAQVRRSPL